jgi:hypothetical protein
MDKMKEKPIEERRKLLISSTLGLGLIVTVFGLWNISSNLVALNEQRPSDENVAVAEADEDVSSAASKLRTEAASVWGSVKGGLEDLNSKLDELKVNGQ